MGVHDFETQHRPGGLDVTDFELELQHQGFFKTSTFLPANPTPMQLQANAKWWQRMLERVCKSEPKVPSWFLEQCREQVKRAGGQPEAGNDQMWLQWLQIFETRESHRQKQLLQYYNQRMAFYLKNMWPTVDSSKLTKQLQQLHPNQHLGYYKKCVEFYQRNIDLVVGSSGPSERSPLVTLPSPDQQYLMDIKYQHQSTNGTVSTFEEDDSTETLAVLPPDEAESGDNDSTNGSDRAWHEVLRLYSA